MSGSHLKHVAVVLGLVFVLSCFLLVAVGSAEEPEMVTITNTKEKQAETAQYWTTERMEKAKPAPLPIIKPEELEKLLKMKRPVEKPKKIEPKKAKLIRIRLSERMFENGRTVPVVCFSL